MKDTLKVAVVGAGMAGQAHAFGYRNASMAARVAPLRVELVAIVDPNRQLARSVADRYGFAEVYPDVDHVLDDPNIDIVSVAVPNSLYIDVLPNILKSGKHLFVEKPLGRSAAEARDLADIARSCGVVAGVGFSFRRLPGLAAMADVVASGRLGPLRHLRAWYYADYAVDPNVPLTWRYLQESSGGGAILDMGAHAIDALQFVAGSISAVLAAQLRTVIERRPIPAGTAVGHGRTDVTTEYGQVTNDDVAVLIVELADGSIGHVEVSRVATGMPNSLGVVVFGANGHASFDSIQGGEFQVFEASAAPAAVNGPRRIFTGPEHPYFADVAPMPAAGVGTAYGEAFIAEIQEFITCVRDGRPMDTNFDTAVATMTVIEAAQHCAAEETRMPVA